jgi:MFS transporter, PAT family, beta-lactamase induction signal transducer AmpG
MIAAVACENITGGMGTAAFVALMMSLCDHRYTATQYAALSALAAVGRVMVGPPSGYVVEAVGWVTFFWLTFLAALPGLWLLWALRSYFGAQAAQSVNLALEDRSAANGPMRP